MMALALVGGLIPKRTMPLTLMPAVPGTMRKVKRRLEQTKSQTEKRAALPLPRVKEPPRGGPPSFSMAVWRAMAALLLDRWQT